MGNGLASDALRGRPADIRRDPIYTIGVVFKHRTSADADLAAEWGMHARLMAKHAGEPP